MKVKTRISKKDLGWLWLLTAFLLVFSFPVFAATVTVGLDNPPRSGNIEIELYDSANAFAAQQDPVKSLIFDVTISQTYTIDNVPAGEYALRVYHDANGNGSIDKNFIGIPTEPIGFSNRYAPKAPPSFSRAAFTLAADETRHFDVNLYLPLGKDGQVSLGLGVIARSSPYRDYSGNVSQAIPAITFVGDRLQVFGPRLQWRLAGSGNLRLALAGEYRIGVYEEADSDFLQGMGDRDSTLLAGPAIQADLPGGVDLEFSYKFDVLDRIGGGVANLAISKSLQFGILRLTPQIGFNYLSSDISNYDFGVPADRATPTRPEYKLDSTSSVEAGFGVFIEITNNWLFIANINHEELSSEVTDSPLVDEDSVTKGFFALNYTF